MPEKVGVIKSNTFFRIRDDSLLFVEDLIHNNKENFQIESWFL